MDRRVFIGGLGSGLLIPTTASAHEFVAYFDYGSSILNAGGYRMVRSARSYAENAVRIRVMAHMDTREAVEFSDELSRRRAQAVASELVLLGVKPELIEMEAHKAERLARPTAENTPEPLNRRVVVDIHMPRSNT